MYRIQSTEMRCTYCKGSKQCFYFNVLTEEQYDLMLEMEDFARNAAFCLACIGRIDAKIARRKTKAQHQCVSLHSHGTIDNTLLTFSRRGMDDGRTGDCSRMGSEAMHSVKINFVICLIF